MRWIRRGLRLEERDYSVLFALEKWGVLGQGQLDGMAFRKEISPVERVRLFFNDTRRSDYWLGAYKRLWKLEKAGFIRSETRQIGQRKLYFLTGRGHRRLRWEGRAAMMRYRKGLASIWFRHELAVNAVGLVVSELLGFEVTTARERYARNRIPFKKLAEYRLIMSDLWIPDEAQPKVIEVELGQKSERRYEEIWAAYRRGLPKGSVLLYLVGWPRGVECLLKHARRYGHPYIHVAHLRDFRRYLGRCAFTGWSPEGGYSQVFLKKLNDSPAVPAEIVDNWNLEDRKGFRKFPIVSMEVNQGA